MAQAGQGTVSGKVLDQRGAPLGGAQVEISGSGGRATATTDADGSYTLSVPPGIYSITVNKGGFKTAETDDVTISSTSLTVDVTMTENSLQNLQVIGRTSASANANTAQFNISETPTTALPQVLLGSRQNNNLSDTVATLPGVVVSRTFSTTPNTDFVVRGGALQTRVTIDGHAVSSGTAGQWNTNYADAGIFQSVDVIRGAGLNGAIAGESAFGTVNLKTRDFTSTNTTGLQLGVDNYNGGFYNVFADVNFLNDKASLIVQKAANFFDGPWFNTTQNRAAFAAVSTAQITAPNGLTVAPAYTGLTQWTGDFSNNYDLEAELTKFRYRFSESTSFTFEFLGMQGQYQPQGGAYAAYDGQMTVGACQNTTTPGATSYSSSVQTSLANCTSQSRYTAPYTFGEIGTVVPAYTWFPSSFIQNNEPHFMAELRTSLGNDTLLFRPYTQVINRYISGALENTYPGNNSSANYWYQVTNTANCQVKFLAPNAAGAPASGAAGPCFSASMSPTSPAYIGADPTGFIGATSATAPVCTAATPCYTTTTAPQNNGLFAYSTPFSQPELDRLNGYTFSWIHPFGNNVLNFNVDWRKDYVQFLSGDTTAAAPGCQYVIGSVFGAQAATFQPACSVANFTAPYASPYDFLPRSPIGTPPTVSNYTDFSLTGEFQLTDKLRMALGNYLELYTISPQIENPTVLAAYAAMGNAAASPVSLVTVTNTSSHYDPHVAFEYRYNPALSLRASFGTSITQPYAALLSGFGSVTLPNAANNFIYTTTLPNFQLGPEVTVAYDAGLDYRVLGNAILSLDGYDNTIHNVWLTNTSIITPPANCGCSVAESSNTVNGPLEKFMGLELSLASAPRIGFGYWASATLQRVFYDQLPASLYQVKCALNALNVCTNVPSSTQGNITGEQVFGYPYFKSYDMVYYTGRSGELYELGMDWEGSNNFTFGPPYLSFDASIKYPIFGKGPNKVFAQLSAQNFLYASPALLGRAVQSAGYIQQTAYINPVSGQVFTNSGETNPLQSLAPATYRFSLMYGF